MQPKCCIRASGKACAADRSAAVTAALLDGGLALDDLPASERWPAGKGAVITSAWQQVLT